MGILASTTYSKSYDLYIQALAAWRCSAESLVNHGLILVDTSRKPT